MIASLTTPTRINRGLICPVLDTKSTTDDISSGIPYTGLHTPPQSAHESRRPSIHSPWTEMQYSAGTSGFSCSHPTTPVHRIQKTHESFMQAWPDVAFSTAGIAGASMQHPIIDRGFHSHTFHTPSHRAPACSPVDQYPRTDLLSLHLHSSQQSPEVWVQSAYQTDAFASPAACLGSDLFPVTQSVSGPNILPESAFDDRDSSFQGLHLGFDIASRSRQDHTFAQASLYQNPQVIVPSQLSPQDGYDQSPFDDYPGLDASNDSLSSSFGSSCATFNSFESLGPESPMNAYLDYTDEHDYVTIKDESPSQSPVRHPTLRASTSSLRSRKRSSKRHRSINKQAWHRHETGGIEVQCEGKQFSIEEPVKYAPGTAHKPHVCKHVNEEGEICGIGFERSEHLKRHAGSHGKVRPYPCPIECCTKKSVKIQRPDNACDHFKTHLRPNKKGKRNPHVEWPVLKTALTEWYGGTADGRTKVNKLIKNLDQWIRDGMPDPGRRPHP